MSAAGGGRRHGPDEDRVTADATALEGYLESPGVWHPASDALVVSGWVFSRGTPVKGVEMCIDDGVPAPLAYGVARPDVERLYSIAGSATSGFGALIPLPDDERAVVHVELVVVLRDDRRVRWLDRRVRFYEAGQGARLRRVIDTVGAALATSLRARRLPPAPSTWTATLRRHWEGLPDLQPRRHVVPQPFDRDRHEESYRRFRSASAPTGAVVAPTRRPPSQIVLIAAAHDLDAIRHAAAALERSDDELVVVWERRPRRDGRELDVTRRDGGPIAFVDVGDLCGPDGRWLPPGASDALVLLDGRSRLAPGGIDRVLRALDDSGAAWVFTDDDQFDREAGARDPYFKGDFSPESALFDDYATRLAAVRRDALAAAGGLQSSAADAQVLDLLLRIVQQGGRVHHVADVCCRRAGRVPLVPTEAHRAVAAQWLSELSDVPVSIVTEDDPTPGAVGIRARVHWPAAAVQHAITIVIPTRDRLELLRTCVDSLARTVDPSRTELLIIDDGSAQEETRDYLAALPGAVPLACRVLRPETDGTFNYARLMNVGAATVATPLMLHLNNDIEAIADGWLTQMAGWLSSPAIGVVGAKLIYRDRSIQHAGVFVSPWQAVPHHLFRRLAAGDPGYQWLPHRPRNVSAVTGACLLTRTQLFVEAGGFDAAHLAVQFNDVDYCLRVIGR
jgi:hypothetical protein